MNVTDYFDENLNKTRKTWLGMLKTPNGFDLGHIEAIKTMLYDSKEVKPVEFKEYPKVEGFDNSPTISRRSKRRSRRK